MTETNTLLAQLTARDVLIEVSGNHLHIDAPPGVVTPEILAALKEQKAEILRLISSWSPECLETERRFGHRQARLYPLIGKWVETPQGVGRLFRVFDGSAGVILKSCPDQVTFMKPERVLPSSCEGLTVTAMPQLTEKKREKAHATDYLSGS